MNRILKLQSLYLQFIDDYQDKVSERDEPISFERIHMASCSSLAYELALKRGADPEISACSAVIHDIGRIITGKQKDHAVNGYEPAKAFLKSTGLFTQSEIEEIALAVKNHSTKTEIGTPVEEIVKDTDVVDCYHLGYPLDRPEKETRYKNWQKEMGLL